MDSGGFFLNGASIKIALQDFADRPLLWLDCMKLHLVSQGRFILEVFWFIDLPSLQRGGGDGLPAIVVE
jgi:hypothetical protein